MILSFVRLDSWFIVSGKCFAGRETHSGHYQKMNSATFARNVKKAVEQVTRQIRQFVECSEVEMLKHLIESEDEEAPKEAGLCMNRRATVG